MPLPTRHQCFLTGCPTPLHIADAPAVVALPIPTGLFAGQLWAHNLAVGATEDTRGETTAWQGLGQVDALACVTQTHTLVKHMSLTCHYVTSMRFSSATTQNCLPDPTSPASRLDALQTGVLSPRLSGHMIATDIDCFVLIHLCRPCLQPLRQHICAPVGHGTVTSLPLGNLNTADSAPLSSQSVSMHIASRSRHVVALLALVLQAFAGPSSA